MSENSNAPVSTAALERSFPGSIEVVNDQLARMLMQARKRYIGWNPEAQPQVGGIIVEVVPGCNCGGFGEHYIINIDQPDNTGIAVHCFHTILRNMVERRIAGNALPVGHLIVVAYLGQVKVNSNLPDAYDYNIVVQPPQHVHA